MSDHYYLTGDRECLCEAVRKWGVDAQLDMVVEECSELIQAICKIRRYGFEEGYNDVLEEMVDVIIMLEQLDIILRDVALDHEDNLIDKKVEKLIRLRKRLEGKE